MTKAKIRWTTRPRPVKAFPAMTSINPHYTFEYSQPEVYRFSHDSVFLARRVFEILKAEETGWANQTAAAAPAATAASATATVPSTARAAHLLDLCAGCGIVGFDFLFHCRAEGLPLPEVADFLEIQPEYEEHFQRNLARLNLPEVRTRFLQQNYTNPFDRTYDLILANPPFFDPSEGKLSPSEFKNRCRFFIDASREAFIKAIARALAPGGRAYVLERKSSSQTLSPLPPGLIAQPAGDIRGTSLTLYSKPT